MQTAFSAMPLGLLYDPTSFPHHSAASRAFDDFRARRRLDGIPKLNESALAAARFQRDADIFALLHMEQTKHRKKYRLLEDQSFK